ncbi:uncharacterized protein LOC118435911 [Folsomia candida]|uniref:Protein FraH n=1 Tax=Folsomia candida TaxID=158441 RepID=A0A226E924_FOLCA|nr:uncharacterized protein LOC118435911 [Folsomia candida]OXA54065.1 Protein FraH [Folsomia candida]
MHSKAAKNRGVLKDKEINADQFSVPAKLWQHKFVGGRWEKNAEQVLPTDKPLLITTQFHRDACCSQGRANILKVKVKDNNIAMVMNPHAEIWLKTEHYFIKDLQSFTGTFVNGVKLMEGEERRLANEDIISFPKDHRDPWFKQWEREGRPIPDSMFKYFEASGLLAKNTGIANGKPSTVQKEKGLDICEISQILILSVIQNPIILSKILSHLSLPALKTARQVCQQWRKESNRFFCTLGHFDIPGVACPHWPTLKAFQEILPIQNVTLDLNPIPKCIKTGMDDWEPIEGTMWDYERAKYLQNLTWFFQTYGKTVKTLQLILKADSWSVFMAILPKLENLQSLALEITSSLNTEEWATTVKFTKDLKLLSVKQLSFKYEERNLMVGRGPGMSLETKYTKLILNILLMFPKLEGIKFTGARLTNFNAIFFKTLEKYPDMMANVDSFSITNGSNASLDPDSLIKGLTKVNFKKKLRKLEIKNVSVPSGNSRTPKLLFNLVQKYAVTLEHLTLGVQNPAKFFHATGYPICPKLKVLKIVVQNKDVTAERGNPTRLQIDYGVSFPALETIIFDRKKKFLKYKYPLSLAENESFIPFLPPNEEAACRTVKTIILPEIGRSGKDPAYTLFMCKLSMGFPNANIDQERFVLTRRGDWHLLRDDGEPNEEFRISNFNEFVIPEENGDLDILQEREDNNPTYSVDGDDSSSDEEDEMDSEDGSTESDDNLMEDDDNDGMGQCAQQ